MSRVSPRDYLDWKYEAQRKTLPHCRDKKRGIFFSVCLRVYVFIPVVYKRATHTHKSFILLYGKFVGFNAILSTTKNDRNVFVVLHMYRFYMSSMKWLLVYPKPGFKPAYNTLRNFFFSLSFFSRIILVYTIFLSFSVSCFQKQTIVDKNLSECDTSLYSENRHSWSSSWYIFWILFHSNRFSLYTTLHGSRREREHLVVVHRGSFVVAVKKSNRSPRRRHIL